MTRREVACEDRKQPHASPDISGCSRRMRAVVDATVLNVITAAGRRFAHAWFDRLLDLPLTPAIEPCGEERVDDRPDAVGICAVCSCASA